MGATVLPALADVDPEARKEQELAQLDAKFGVVAREATTADVADTQLVDKMDESTETAQTAEPSETAKPVDASHTEAVSTPEPEAAA